MKIAIGYPPLESEKGIAQLSQNRQFQWTAAGPMAYFIYPVIPASAATLLVSKDYEMFWCDGLAEKQSYQEWVLNLLKIKPDLLAIESKTPVIKSHWQIIADLKKKLPKMKIVLMGDHVTSLPEESMINCPVDFIITGGDYDFLLLNIANYLTRGDLPAGRQEKLESGIWYRTTTNNKVSTTKILNTGKFKLNHDLNSLPMIDRDLTKWQLYASKNSNFYRSPGAYTMFGRDCWWGKCSFCSWTTLFPGNCFRKISVEKAIKEVNFLVNEYHVREIMDDSGTFPDGEWMRGFCEEMIKRGLSEKVRISCNMRFNADLTEKDYQLMGRAGFRFILYGLESASQNTLDKINKNSTIELIEPVLKMAKKAGLKPHLTVMVGYPWESEIDMNSTLALAEKLFAQGLADTMQATIVIPYPGTPLFTYCKKNSLLKTTDWDRYDMREIIMKTKIPDEKLMNAIRSLYSQSIKTPRFLLNTLMQLNTIDGIKYVGFQSLKYFGKLWEFK